ncbi:MULTISPECIES: hypothetical protein [unclassified Cryobacterium]|uniref:hypothetical protein n=1 Tax=unclassified Cryobacterium TaxID=2649013 RepID=UPI00106BA752|nr:MULTISPECIES: hypothetical protein [unclassified Cryobacterium]TFC55529.1 hypothetical protein E3O68_05775 [Cryobacterium sp. TMB3-1-2]TFC72915.1 hypothetical protein E3T21_05760 [Cryobacterium sp. TMB3-15]TFC76421.1 hypothetical protein E3T22_10900 [Cryobacterium sp. TMB3-10]TFD43636.1 hypothetical protein E3T58_07515 [Cryobacterium sp. TMB3-12]
MSTDLTSGQFSTADPDTAAGGRRFRRTLAALLTGLIVLCLALVAVNVLNGPRLTGFQVDTSAVVTTANQRLVLDTNQQLAEVSTDQITVSPAGVLDVQTRNDSIVIVFPQPLAYDTEYTVTVNDVTGPFADRSSDLAVSFRTDEAPLYLLSRSPAQPNEPTKAPDRIVRTTVGSAETSVAFSAPYIQSFVPVGDELVVVTLTEDLTNTLSLVDRDGRAAELTMPGTGTVHDLQASPSSSTIGFRFTSAAGAGGHVYDNTLFLLDLTRGTVDTVTGLDGEPVQAIAWGFMANRAEVVAQLFDTTLLLIDPRAGTETVPIPIGQFPNLNAFAPDGLRIAVSDQDRQYILDLSTGAEAAIVPQDVAGTTPYTAELRFLTGGEGYVQRVAEFDQATGRVGQSLILVTGDPATPTTRVVYEPVLPNETIVGFAISPNDQYLAIQTVPNSQTQVTDGYPVDPQATTATTLFVDLSTGAITRSIVGIDATW